MAKISPEEAIAKVRARFGDVVVAKPLREPRDRDEEEEITDVLTRVCYFYPQYDLDAVEKLTNDQVMALLWQAERQRAIELYNHTLIAAAPHTKKGGLVSKLTKQYKKILGI